VCAVTLLCRGLTQNDPNPLSDPAGSIKHYEAVRVPLPSPLDRRCNPVNVAVAIPLHCRLYNPLMLPLQSRYIAVNITVAM
jgi:hypothetical protein